MIRRLKVHWPGPLARRADGRPLRFLAVSDEVERALESERNRAQIEPLDAVLGCGDLEPDYLCFLADAFNVPLLYVRGNHDRGANWRAGRQHLPRVLGARAERLLGLPIVGLSWPGNGDGRAIRDGGAAWRQAIGCALRVRARRAPLIVLSHVPPRGLGDTPADVYHRGFSAYHWLCRRLRPALWLHGHTAPAAAKRWHVEWGPTTLVNATGAVLIELAAGSSAGATIDHHGYRSHEGAAVATELEVGR